MKFQKLPSLKAHTSGDVGGPVFSAVQNHEPGSPKEPTSLKKLTLKRHMHHPPHLSRCLLAFSAFFGTLHLCAGQSSNGLAPEVPGLNLVDNLYQLEAQLSDLEQPYISSAPADKKDGLAVGRLGDDGGDRAAIEAYANELAAAAKDDKAGNVDSMLICCRGKLIFESYYRRGRGNFPHYQMSITKSYTALSIGRAIQLGLLKMEDLDKPAISFLKELDKSKLVAGADTITLAQAMQMGSGIRLADEKAKQLIKNPAQLKGQAEIQAYLQYSDPIPPMPRTFKYQEPDTAIAMQVLNAVAPHGAEEFIKTELLGRMGITQYHWEHAISGLPKSSAGSAILSRDMVKFGQLILNKGRWKGEQLIPEAYISRATTPSQINGHYGFFWWVDDFTVDGKTCHSIQGRGAGGQFIFMFPELDLVTVITSHDKGMGSMLKTLPQRIIPLFTTHPDNPKSQAQHDPSRDEKDLRELLQATLDFYGRLQRTPSGFYRDAYLINDSQRPNHFCSTAATGVGLMALCMDHALGRDEAAQPKALQTLQAINGKSEEVKIGREKSGCFQHFFSSDGGAIHSQHSTIDTAIMVVGALYCRNTFSDPQIKAEADQLWNSMDWNVALADPTGRDIYMVIEDGKPVEARKTHLFNEYYILAWLIREAQLQKTGHSDVVTFHQLNTWDNRGIKLLCANGPWVECSFLVQFPLFMCQPCATDPLYHQFALAQAKADQRECFERTRVAEFWGCGAGGTPGGKYRASNYRHNPDNIVSPHIIAGFMPVFPQAREHLLKLYRDPNRRVQSPAGVLLPRFSVDKPEWRAARIESIDYSSMLFGLAAMHPQLGMRFFAEKTALTFNRRD
jgi:CubicO group peptidase (beta-lactamase class C family)